MDASPLQRTLLRQAEDILGRCTACGACAEICPMPGPAGIGAADPKALAAMRSCWRRRE